jgi:hypothetical protein
MARIVSLSAQEPRDPSNKPTDILALRALAQAAVDVELFTIPLYMTSLYSIAGRHEINDQNALYKGWIWPGAGPVAEPASPNDKAFNILFSIFIEEMLHLQMAGNMATAVGISPSFTSTSLQTKNHGWKCYGDNVSIIPNIIDLKDTILEDPNSKTLTVPVNIGPLDATRLKLFIAIEQPDAQAHEAILPEARGKYFPPAPFPTWIPAQPLPLFGTIGHMYQCYYDYLHISYTDGTSLWDAVFDPKAVQQDHFNQAKKPKQYGFDLALKLTDSKTAFAEMCTMMDAITDQGEGSVLDPLPTPPIGGPVLEAVLEGYRSIKPNLEQIYVSYDADGQKLPESADANARSDNDGDDHYERFLEIQAMLPDIVTWAQAGKSGNWQPSDFIAPGGQPGNPYGLPSPEDLAAAWNKIATEDGCLDTNFVLLSKACVGSIAGTTTVLENYWKDPTVGFPGPAMGATGNRMSTIWAAFGRAPVLSLGLDPLQPNTLGHSCQAIDYNIQPGGTVNDCATVETYHGCIGSNNCHAEGGCGFVNKVTGGGSCSGGGGGSCSTEATVGGSGVGTGSCSASGATAGKCGSAGVKADCSAASGTEGGKCGSVDGVKADCSAASGQAGAEGGKCGSAGGVKADCSAASGQAGAEGAKCGSPEGAKGGCSAASASEPGASVSGSCGASAGAGGTCGSAGGAKADCSAAPGQAGAEGGKCGSPDAAKGGGCGAVRAGAAAAGAAVGGSCGAPQIYSGPGDNKCQGFGGCAVPISASQLYPPPPDGRPQAQMQVFDFQPDSSGFNGYKSVEVGKILYQKGDKVDEVAYRAFQMVMKNRSTPVEVPETMPAPSTIRLVFPPST